MNADRESARSDGHWMTSLVLPILCASEICGPGFARASDPGYRPRVAVGLYAWVQDRARRGMSVDEDLDVVLGEVRGAGLRAVEGFLDFFASDAAAERTRTLLAKHRVVLAGVYTGGVLYDQPPDSGRPPTARYRSIKIARGFQGPLGICSSARRSSLTERPARTPRRNSIG